jgi:hypothetical protein
MTNHDETADGNTNNADRPGKPQNDQESSDGQNTGESKKVDPGHGLICCSRSDYPVDFYTVRGPGRRVERRAVPRLRRTDNTMLTEGKKEDGERETNEAKTVEKAK